MPIYKYYTAQGCLSQSIAVQKLPTLFSMKRQQNRQQTRKLRAFEAACSCAQPKIRSIGQKFD